MTVLSKPDWLAYFRKEHGKSAFGLLGGELLEVDEESLTISLPLDAKTQTPFGFLHGGISMFLAETAASTHACYGIDLGKERPVGIEISGSHLKAAESGFLITRARLLNKTRRLLVHAAETRLQESQELLSVGRVTNYLLSIRD